MAEQKQFNLYKAKDADTWKKLLRQNLPKGHLFDAVDVKGTEMYILFKALGIIFARFDKIYEGIFNGLEITKDSPYLHQWWDALNIKRFISIPEDKELQAKIIRFFIRAKQGVFTTQQMEDIIRDIFGIDIKIRILNFSEANTNVFKTRFPFFFSQNTDFDNYYTIIIEFPRSYYEYSQAFDRDDYFTVIKEILRYFININYKVIYYERDWE